VYCRVLWYGIVWYGIVLYVVVRCFVFHIENHLCVDAFNIRVQEISSECQSLMRVTDVFKHGIYPPQDKGVRRGYAAEITTLVALRRSLTMWRRWCFCARRAMLMMMLEYCRGGTLRDRVHQSRKPPPSVWYDWILQVRGVCLWRQHRSAAAHS
jgi:hypothetical protein